MTEPGERFVRLSAGLFRTLDWPGQTPAAVFLHGLSGLADVWRETVDAFGGDRPHCVAVDQRGHGHSPRPNSGYTIGRYVQDAAQLIDSLGDGPVHLVGHSMGARVALVLAARAPQLVRSVAILDIGPEQWQANIDGSVAAFDRMPRQFASRAEALAFASRGRMGFVANEAMFFRRLRALPDGSYEWLADPEALKATVRSHRARHYWRDWADVRVPALFVRGGESTEVRPRIALKMRAANPTIRYEEFEGVAHNIPLLAPDRLAATLRVFWRSVKADRRSGGCGETSSHGCACLGRGSRDAGRRGRRRG
ncbi:MAG: alpha/beta hydrolase [Anaerolineaceae bacterium]